MDETTMQEILHELVAAWRSADLGDETYLEVRQKMHKLAEAQFVPAQRFFLTCLDDTRWDWRLDCLTSLGFHYDLLTDGATMQKIRDLLLNDPNSQVRIAAASVLGSAAKWPNDALIQALRFDSDRIVRRTAFSALLNIAGIDNSVILKEDKNVEEGEILPDLEEVKRIVSEQGLDLDFTD